MRFLICLFSFTLLIIQSEAQTITHGPIWGAVTDSSSKVFLRTSSPTSLTVALSKDSSLTNTQTFTDTTRASADTSSTLQLTGLEADTRYYYRIKINGVTKLSRSHFSTLPSVGDTAHQVITFGSCHGVNDSLHDSLYITMAQHNPDLFLQIGDWQYPDAANTVADTQFHTTDMANVRKSYRERYSKGPFLPRVLRKMPVDYIYDDHDYTGNNAGQHSAAQSNYNSGNNTISLSQVPYPSPQTRNNVIKGYDQFFPHYALPDTSAGVYHKIRSGNAVFYMLDVRANRSPNLEAFDKDPSTGTWSFNPPPGHTMLGQKQLNWLLQELQTTGAKWKFIVTPVIFNHSHQDLLDFFLNTVQLIQGDEAVNTAAILADKWAGFPDDQDTLLQVIDENDISNVIALSGDAHTAAIDDGANAGIPEMMSANLAQWNSRMAARIDSNYVEPVWNQGGQGIGSDNFNSTFGKVEIFGSDSVRLRILDRHDQLIASHTVVDSTTNEEDPQNAATVEQPVTLQAYPNPARETLLLKVPEEWQISSIKLYDMHGQVVRTYASTTSALDVTAIEAGQYLVAVETEKGIAVQKITVR